MCFIGGIRYTSTGAARNSLLFSTQQKSRPVGSFATVSRYIILYSSI